MMAIQNYLKEYGLDNFINQYKMKVCYHSEMPILILNYNNIRSPKNNVKVDTCRGIVIENHSWKIISKGMDRFYQINKQPNPRSKIQFTSAEIKEDGTLLHLFCYNGIWLLSTRHNFGDDFLDNSLKMTYIQLFEQICNNELQELGSNLDPSITYCLEMCSEHNRIIRKYITPVIYLLACYRDGIELDITEVDHELNKINKINNINNWLRPKSYLIKSIEDCNEVLQCESNTDPLFEGLVIRDANGGRYKLKNNLYLEVHKLKYRGWILALPELCSSIIQKSNGKMNLIYEALSHNRSKYDMIEYKKRFDIIINSNDDDIINMNMKVDPFIDKYHDKKYCISDIPLYSSQGIAEKVPIYNGLFWEVTCYCGAEMKLHRIKNDYLMYKRCPKCNVDFDIHVYTTGTLIWLCTSCNLTHDAHQNDFLIDSIKKGQPTGIPCSMECKNLRLATHQILSEIGKIAGLNRTETYSLLANLLKMPRESAHMALFNTEMCYNAICLLKEYFSSVILH
jgi:hypothetical protein